MYFNSFSFFGWKKKRKDLLSCGASTSQIKSVEGLGQADPIANNDTAEGRQQNRRVEVYMYASQQMIQQAEAGTLK